MTVSLLKLKSLIFSSPRQEGYLQLIINDNLQDGSKYGIIENVFVKKECRKKGIATQLIKDAVNYAKENNLYKIILNCSDQNIDLYHKNGFKVYQYNMRHFLKNIQ